MFALIGAPRRKQTAVGGVIDRTGAYESKHLTETEKRDLDTPDCPLSHGSHTREKMQRVPPKFAA
ncbi:hypothetical protein A2U01_0081990, partial [Trifolium medium]|nr:hypothetical protein [Trifolium medium]